MISGPFLEPVACLYYLCFLLLLSLTLFIACHRGRRSRAQSRLRRVFFLLALCLLLWQLTLFLEDHTTRLGIQNWLGRANFAVVVLDAYLALRFVQEVPAKRSVQRSVQPLLGWWLPGVTWLLATLTALTPLVDAAERVERGHAITTFGPLFPVYLLHIVGCLAAALILAFQKRRRSQDQTTRSQLALIGAGMLVTGGVALVGNALLPYGVGDFRFCDLGALSTLAFLLAVAYATFVHHLFDLRIIIRAAVVYGMLMMFVLGAYSSTVFLVTQYLAKSAGTFTQFSVLLIAFSLDPLRRFLEKKTDRLLFGGHKAEGKGTKQRDHKQRGPAGNMMALALLFPWRRS